MFVLTAGCLFACPTLRVPGARAYVCVEDHAVGTLLVCGVISSTEILGICQHGLVRAGNYSRDNMTLGIDSKQILTESEFEFVVTFVRQFGLR